MNDGIDILRNANHAKIRKIPATRNEQYLQFVRLKPCLVHGCNAPATAAHLVPKGAARNHSSDYWAVPLCVLEGHHREQEEKGNDWFEKEYNVDFVLAIELQLHEFFLSLISNSEKPNNSVKKSAPIKTTKPKDSGFEKWIAEMSDEELMEKGSIYIYDTVARIRRGKWDRNIRERLEKVYKERKK